jgi:hypothetical protein
MSTELPWLHRSNHVIESEVATLKRAVTAKQARDNDVETVDHLVDVAIHRLEFKRALKNTN